MFSIDPTQQIRKIPVIRGGALYNAPPRITGILRICWVGSIENIFFGKVGNFFEHQERSRISLRIEWEHSQPLKTTLKHNYPAQL